MWIALAISTLTLFSQSANLQDSSDRVGEPLERIECAPGYTAFLFAADLSSPDGLCFSPEGDLIVVEESSGRLTSISQEGKRIVLAKGLDSPEGVCLGPDRSYFVTEDCANGRLLQILPGGDQLVIAKGLNAAEGVVWLPGKILFTDSAAQLTGSVLSAKSRLLSCAQVNGSWAEAIVVLEEEGPLSFSELVPDGNNGVILANESAGGFFRKSLLRVDLENKTMTTFSHGLSSPEGLSLASESSEGIQLWVAEENVDGKGHGRISKVSQDGAAEIFATGFLQIEDVLAAPNGSIFVSEDTSGYIIELRPTLPADTAQIRDLSPMLAEVAAQYDLAALAGIVITSGGMVAEGYTGTHVSDGEVPVVAANLFHLGSCTKAMTATVIATFVEEGALTWSTTLAEVFPELEEGMHEAWRSVTIAQLLSHTSGASLDLTEFQGLAWRVFLGVGSLQAQRLDVVKTLTASPPTFKPGESYQYSNWGYTMAGAIAERLADQPWEEIMQERLFLPLAMTSCGFGAPNQPKGKGQPCGHSASNHPSPGADNPPVIGPAGTVHASMRDWAKFAQLHLRGARGDKGLLLKPETFAALTKPQPGTHGTYGGGWITLKRDWSEGSLLMHSGSNLYWTCYLWIVPQENFAVLVACNRGGVPGNSGTDLACWNMIQEQLASLELEIKD